MSRVTLLSFRTLYFVGLLLLPIIFYLTPVDHIYGGETLCLYTRLGGEHCWGCGITRAVYATVHLDFDTAWEYNRGVIIVVPLLVYLWGREVWRQLKWLKRG